MISTIHDGFTLYIVITRHNKRRIIMARIYKKNNSYYFSLEAGKDRTGKRQRVIRGGFKTKKEAQQVAAELETKIYNGTFIINQKQITLHEFMWEHWLEYHKSFVKPSTMSSVRIHLKRIEKFFGKKIKLKDITPYKCSQFTRALMQYGIQRDVAGQTFIYLKMVFKYAIQIEKLLNNNPCDNITLPKYTIAEKEQLSKIKKEKLLFLEKDELKKFLVTAAADEQAFPYYTVLSIMTYTGMRIGEVLALQWEDIDLDNKIIHVKHTLFRNGKDYFVQSAKTTTSIRDIVLSDSLVKQIRGYRKIYLAFKLQHADEWTHNDFDFVITSRTRYGEPLHGTTINAWLNKIAKRTGIGHVHAHLFRHTHVSLLAEAGVSLPAIRERLGHSHDKITEEIYLHITKKYKADAAAKFEKLLSNL